MQAVIENHVAPPHPGPRPFRPNLAFAPLRSAPFRLQACVSHTLYWMVPPTQVSDDGSDSMPRLTSVSTSTASDDGSDSTPKLVVEGLQGVVSGC